MRKLMKIFMALTAVAVIGCTGVDYSAPDNQPDSVDLSFRYDWGEDSARDTMYVIMSRIINTIHYAWRSQDAGETFVNIGVPDTTGFTVSNGEYYLLSFNKEKTFSVSGLDEFITDPAASPRDIRITALEATEEEISAMYGENSPDFNPLYPYLTETDPLYIEVLEVDVKPGMNSEIVMTPQYLTQNLTFRIRIELEDGVEVEEITGEISGVGGSIEAMSGHVDADQTYRAMFRMTETSVSEGMHVYEGAVNAFGLFPSVDPGYITGPGIMHLNIRAASGSVSNTFHAGINLRETIMTAGLTQQADDGLYRISVPSALLEIQNRLVISRDQIAGGNEMGMENWFESDEHNIDFEL